jgi:hypothetical protein
MYIDIARAHIREREQEYMRSERITDITPSIQRALAVAPLADLQTPERMTESAGARP